MSNFGFGKIVESGFEEAVQRVTEELAKEGFGVLTVIDVQATLKAKLDVDMPGYRILGACNPGLATRPFLPSRISAYCYPVTYSCVRTKKGRFMSGLWTRVLFSAWSMTRGLTLWPGR